MMMQFLLPACLLLGSASLSCDAFGVPSSSPLLSPRQASLPQLARVSTRVSAEDEAASSPVEDYDLLPPVEDDEAAGSIDNTAVDDTEQKKRAADMKSQLYRLAASYDRGFGATPKARDEADDIIRELAALNPTADASRGIDGDGRVGDDVPLKAIWRMVWTSAFDVVSLGASPFAAPSAIYQDITNPPEAINIIDFIPRAQTFLPASIAQPSLLRAEVKTRASSRRGMTERVGLIFEGLKLQPIELLGQKVDNLPPLSVDFMWPRNLVEQIADFVPGLEKESLGLGEAENVSADAPGYFDVEYLDDELLIIRQQVPGGVFALVKVDSCEP